jgi:hypothetical protein
MDFMDKLKAFFKAEGFKIDEESPDKGTSGVSAAEFKALKDELTALKAQVTVSATFSDSQLKSEAVAFADKMIAEKKAIPAEREEIARSHFAAAQADRTAAQFADGKMVTPLLDNIKASYEKRGAHRLTEERIVDIEENEDDAIFAIGPRAERDSAKKQKQAQDQKTIDTFFTRQRSALNGHGKGA